MRLRTIGQADLANSFRVVKAFYIPISLTLARLFLGLVAIPLFLNRWGELLLICFILMLATDILDGYLARRCQVTTTIGAILDYTVDRFNFYCILVLLVHVGVTPIYILPFILRDSMALAASTYIEVPKIAGTKTASVAGTLFTYGYALYLANEGTRNNLLEIGMFALLCASLVNMIIRLARRHEDVSTRFLKDVNESVGMNHGADG